MSRIRTTIALALASFLGAASAAWAQLPPPITPPATGTEKITCYQSNVPKTCTSLQIGQTVTAGPNTWTGNQTFTGNTAFGGSLLGGVNSVAYGVTKSGRGVQIGPPPSAPTAASSGSGVLTGTFKYAYTETDGVGETSLSPQGTVVLSAQQALVTVPEPRRGTSTRRLWRTKAGGSTFYLVNDFGGGQGYFQNQWVDNTPDSSLTIVAPASDTTNLFSLEMNNSVKYLRTAPDQGNGPADLTVLTGNNGYTSGTYALDVYGEYFGRTYVGNTFASLKTGTQGAHFLAQVQGTTFGGPSATTVTQIMPNGNMLLTPLTLSDPGLADSMSNGINVVTTSPTTPTATQFSNQILDTGAGSAAFSQTSLLVSKAAGYTGSSATYALRGNNVTASSGTSFGSQMSSGGVAALNVGVAGLGSGATKNIGVFGTSGGVDLGTTALTWPGGVSGAGLGASNGNNTDDILILWDNVTPVGEFTNNGGFNLQGLAANSSTAYDFGTNGKGNFRILANGNTSTDIGSTNNVPVNIKANGTTVLTVGTNQSVSVVPLTATYTVGSGGNYATITAALADLNKMVLQCCGFVTLNILDGGTTEPGAITWTGAFNRQINVQSQHTYSFSLTSIQSSSGSAGAWSYVLNLNSVTNIAVNDYLMVYGVSGGTNPTYVSGVWKVTAVDTLNNRVTLATTGQQAAAASGAVTGTVIDAKGIIKFGASDGFQVWSGASTLNISDVVVVGNGTGSYNGLSLQDVGRLYVNDVVGVAGWGGSGIYVNYNSEFNGSGPFLVSSSGGPGIYLGTGASLDGNSLVSSGNAGGGVLAESNAVMNTFNFSTFSGNTGFGAKAQSGGTIVSQTATNATGNTNSGLFAANNGVITASGLNSANNGAVDVTAYTAPTIIGTSSVTGGNLVANGGSTSIVGWSGKTVMYGATSDGVLLWTKNAGQGNQPTVSQLPACTSSLKGARSYVTDSTVAASGNFGAGVTGSGSNETPVWCDGATTTWRIGKNQYLPVNDDEPWADRLHAFG